MLNAEIMRLPTAARRHTTHLFDGLDSAPFNTVAYSRMKFGCGASARLLGREMAEAFAAEFWETLTRDRVLVIPAPSTTVPVAATLMGWHFHNRLNEMLDSSGHQPVEWDLVHRAVTYNDNYSQLGLEERRKLLEDDERYMNVAFAQGKTLVFVDDVRITGTHEDKLAHMLHGLGLNSPVVYATYAAYSGADPSIEHRLNHVSVRDGACVAAMTNSPEWSVTTRGLRLLLEYSGGDFEHLLRQMTPSRVAEIYHGAIIKGYTNHAPYAANVEVLRRLALEQA